VLIAVIVTGIACLVLGVSLGWLLASRKGDRAASAEQARLHSEMTLLRSERDRLALEHSDRSALDERLQPLRDSVEGLRRQAQDAEVQRAAAAATLREQIDAVQRNYTTLEAATAQLVAAMSSGQSRGQWGEMQLEQLLTYSGLIEGIHFHSQVHQVESGLRPDIVVSMPGGGEIFVDAKFPFDSYWRGIQADDPAQAHTHLVKHAADVLARAKELAKKGYSAGAQSPDFVIMFLPLESLLSTALEADGDLLVQAFELNVILATPTSMLAMLRTIDAGHQRGRIAANAEEIRAQGALMLQRLETLAGHVGGVERGLTQAVRAYNALVGSFDHRVLTQARKMQELGVSSQTALSAPAQVTESIRVSASQDLPLPEHPGADPGN